MSEMNSNEDDLPQAVTGSKRQILIAYVLAYRAPDYIRSQCLVRALDQSPDIELLVARNRSTGILRYLETWRALRQLRNTHSPDVYILGFRGHEIFWLVRWLIGNKPLVFDALMSPSASLREERKGGLLGRLLAPLINRFERGILRNADLVLTDTRQHALFYETHFSLRTEHILAIPVGAVETAISSQTIPQPEIKHAPFSVLFYGSMLPLHGIDVIVSAAALLTDLPIRFDFIGGKDKQSQQLHSQCAAHGVSQYTHRKWVPMTRLLEHEIPRADICLGGPFGNTPQAQRVVTSKSSQGLALGKATVIGSIDEGYGFIDKCNCLLVPQADAPALAAALRWCYENRECLHAIGMRGKQLYADKLSVASIASALIPALQHLADSDSITNRESLQ